MKKPVSGTRDFKALIVDDNSFFRELFTVTLREKFASIEFYQAGDGEETLRRVETSHPNLIFMDIRLPGENGLELTRKIKVAYPDIIIIILTSYDLPEYREAANQHQADYFFSKGSSPSKNIFRLVESILPARL